MLCSTTGITNTTRLRPISLLTLSLLTLLESDFPGNPLRAWEFHPFKLRLCSSQTLKSTMLVGRWACTILYYTIRILMLILITSINTNTSTNIHTNTDTHTNTILYYTALFYMVLYYIILCCTILCYTLDTTYYHTLCTMCYVLHTACYTLWHLPYIITVCTVCTHAMNYVLYVTTHSTTCYVAM